MKRYASILILLALLLTGVLDTVAQSFVKHGEQKSLMGIEVHFRRNASDLDLTYMDNDRSLARFAHVVDSIGLFKIDSIVVVSQSSPEGSYEHNMHLSKRRAATMRHTIGRRHPELKELLRVHPDGESWLQLREYVASDTIMSRQTIAEVLAVIDSDVKMSTKKWRMQQLDAYSYLYETYYPRIRNSVFCILYYKLDMMVAQIDNLICTAIEPVPVPVDTILPSFPIRRVEYPRPLLNIRTNLFYDLGTMFNVGAELYLGSHWSMLADYIFPWWSLDKSHLYFQMLNGQLEARRYFDRLGGHTGHYLSAYGHANLYDFSFDAEHAWQGEGWGVGLGYGYVWHPWRNERWKLEAFVKVGYYHSLYDPYHASNPYNGKYYYDWEGPIEDFIRRNHRLRWFGPTGVGVTISYDITLEKLKVK
ncbi:MAG: DUF3575 domain-containing protein [Bacteroidaceae bacterium]|nr:DUF3575 domain-containing protein [Bacteroidaceae bacterium]